MNKKRQKANVLKYLQAQPAVRIVQLWAETANLAEARMDPPRRSLFVQAINETIDLHTSRVTVGLHYRIPDSLWLCLYGATFCGMCGVGYQFGLATQTKVLIHVLLAALFSMVVLLIADLDRVDEGYVKVDQLPMQYPVPAETIERDRQRFGERSRAGELMSRRRNERGAPGY